MTFHLELTKREMNAIKRSNPIELAEMARNMKRDAWYAYLDGRNIRSKLLNRKAMQFAKKAIDLGYV